MATRLATKRLLRTTTTTSLRSTLTLRPLTLRSGLPKPSALRSTTTITSRPFSSTAIRKTEDMPPPGATHAKIENPVDTYNFLNNEYVQSSTTEWLDLHDPATNNLVTRVPCSTDAELQAAVDSAAAAFPAWRAESLLRRQQVMFKLVQLIRRDWDRIAASITLEQGKTFADAKGDVLRGLQVVETACGITTQLTGEVLEVAKDMETRVYKEPLGVVAAICPFSEWN